MAERVQEMYIKKNVIEKNNIFAETQGHFPLAICWHLVGEEKTQQVTIVMASKTTILFLKIKTM